MTESREVPMSPSREETIASDEMSIDDIHRKNSQLVAEEIVYDERIAMDVELAREYVHQSFKHHLFPGIAGMRSFANERMRTKSVPHQWSAHRAFMALDIALEQLADKIPATRHENHRDYEAIIRENSK